ncbi:MAG: response regulator transcription factor [Bacteroidetes bacterium]|nr:response regulator transcription factor [Bacteroidota bacterium]
MFEKNILIVEDEQNLADTLALNLKLENYNVVIAYSGTEALKKFNSLSPTIDLVLLDVMLPEINGFDLYKEFKTSMPHVPIIFLTARNESADKIAGLKLGADDYIVKPFELEELLLRVSNILKRNQKSSPSVFKFNACSINFETFEIEDIRGSSTTLSKREIGLLKLLTSSANKVISREEIIEALWNPDENASSRTIDNYILSFRKYFEINPKEPKHFHSIRGVGYKFTHHAK